MADPVSWKVIEHGWTVVDAQGKEVGKIHDVLGDPNADIFSGLTIHTGLLAKKYVPSELVGEIVEGQVRLQLSEDEIDALGDSTP
jgi:uncharacterized protein YrrD